MKVRIRSGKAARWYVGLLAWGVLGLLPASGSAAAQAPPRVLAHNRAEPRVLERALPGAERLGPPAGAGAPLLGAGDPVCDAASVAWHGQPLPDGEQGTLAPLSFFRSSTLNEQGRVAFFAQVEGAERNQGIFTADAEGLQIVALGCGGPGGSGQTAACGDPSPVGGSFSGFFSDTHLVPDINDFGDVLFIADIHAGDTPRGLFLYRAASDAIQLVAAIGKPIPGVGIISELGSGNLNNAGMVVFVARLAGADAPAVFLWAGSFALPYVAVGDPAPGGGTFTALVTESFGYADGTTIWGGPLPGFNDQGQVSFRGLVAGGEAERGLFLSASFEHEWLVRAGDPVPGGGTYVDFQAPLLNEAGQVAFFADIQEAAGPNSAWIAGSPGDWRRAAAFFEPIGDAQIWGLAFSRNPMSALDDQGNLALWIDRRFPDDSMRQAVILSRADGERVIVAAQGEPTPEGGTYGSIDAWPALNDAAQARVGAGTPGLPGQLNTELVLTFCPTGSDPTIGVDPDSLEVTLESGQSEERFLTISNLGGGTLSWDLFGGDGCFPPSWVDAQPFGGSIPGGESQEMTVTFDASGLPSGTHTATLCLISNDPVTPMVTVPLELTVTPADGPTILFNQLTTVPQVAVGMPVQLLAPPHPLDAEGADDFEVFDADGWTIGEVVFGTPQFGLPSNPGQVDVRVYPDAGGAPGEPALCAYEGIAATQHGTLQLRVPLPTPCMLGAGRYWLSLQRRGGLLRWATAAPAPLPPPFILGEHAHWRNPGDGWDTGCTGWSDVTTCLVEGEPVTGSFDSQSLFQICGAVGLDPEDFTGCGNEAAGLDLAVTLAVDNGDPEQCGTTPTLEVDAGDRVNVCYTATNTGNATLDFHWLRDNLSRIGCRGACAFSTAQTIDPEARLAPGEALQFNRLLTATRSQTIDARWEATDELPWYFSVQQGFDFVDISGSGTALDLDDDGSANLIMPFRFEIFGTSSDQLCVNNNGFLLFDWSRPCDGYHMTPAIPTDQVRSTGVIAPFWDDLFTGGNVYHAVVGEAPGRRFIVQWHDKNHYNDGQSDPGGVTFQVILDETTQAISFQYLDTTFDNPQHPEWDRGGRAAVGFQQFVAGFGGPWRIHSTFQPVLDPQSGLTWHSMGYFHAAATAAATLDVRAPAIAVNPETLDATVEQGGSTSAPLAIANTGELDLSWQVGASPLSSRSHFPAAAVPTVAHDGAGESTDPTGDAWDSVSGLKAVRGERAESRGGDPDPFATRAFAQRLASTPPFGPRFDRLNDLADPGDTEEVASLFGTETRAGAFIGGDFGREFAIDIVNERFFSIDTGTGEPTLDMGRVLGSSEVVLWRGMTWDATTATLFAVGTDTFAALPETRFFLARLDRGHDIVATTIGELPGVPQGVALVQVAVDSMGRLFGVDVIGDRLFAIDKVTAEAAPIGSLGFDAAGAIGLDFDDATGTLYLSSVDGGSVIGNLYTVDTVTGEANALGQLGDGSQHTALAIASGIACVPPTEVPWVSVLPASGTTAPEESSEVTVTLDASELGVGTHEATVCLGSNDPLRPVVSVPLSLTVTEGGEDPVIDVDPDSIESTLPPGDTETRDLTISNLGGGILQWEVTEEGGAGMRAPRPVVRRTSAVPVGAREGRRGSRTVMKRNGGGVLAVSDAAGSVAVAGRGVIAGLLASRTTAWSVDSEVSIAASVAIDGSDVWGAWNLNGSHLSAYLIADNGIPDFEFPAQHGDGFVGVTAAKGADRALFVERDLFTGDENIRVHAFTSQSDGTADWSFEFPTLVGSAPTFRNVALSRDGSTAAATGFRDVGGGEEESTLYVLDAATGDVISTWSDPSRMQAVDLTDDGSLALVSQDAQATLVDTATGEVAFQTPGSGGNSIDFRISGDGSVFVVGGFDFDVYELDGETYQRVIHFTRQNTWFGQASVVSRDGSTVGTFGGDFASGWLQGEVFLFDVASREMLGSFPVSGSGEYQGTPVDAASSDDGSVLAFASWGTQNNDWPEIQVFNRGVELIGEIDFPGSAFAVDLSPDGSQVVGGAKAMHANEFGTGGRIELFELAGGEPGDCALPEWVSVDPLSGSVPGGGSQVAGVTFDATGLEPGDYETSLCLASNDPATPLVTVPLSLAVEEGPSVEFAPAALVVDPDGSTSNGNGVLEPGETVDVAPSWRNLGDVSASLTGAATSFTGPAGADYTIAAGAADYGLVAGGATASCLDTGTCYELGVSDPAERPATHWDAVLDEELSDGTMQPWTLHVGASFTDVPETNLFYSWIETLLHARVTGGCAAGQYCPAAPNTRAQMAVFLLKAFEGDAYVPPACTGVFGDVPCPSLFADWIEDLASRGVTAGCGGGNYCPNSSVSRDQMAVFLLKTLEGPGYAPPACTGVFGDVPCPSLFANWIEDLVARGITAGCGGGNYCPANPVSRDQMAVFLSKTFGLTLYGP